MKSSVDIACEILDELKGRGGFDNWWDDVDDATRDEILTRMSSIISEEWPHGPQAPILRVTVNDQYEISSCAQYTPGLPPGDHDLYCEPPMQGSSAAECEAHNLEVAGSIPAPASSDADQPAGES